MSDVRLDIYLLGEPQPGVDRSTLVRNLAATFKKDVPIIEKMLRKSRSLLKANVDSATAAKYKVAIHKAGGQCEWVNHGETLFPGDALHPVAPRSALTIAPLESTPLKPVVDDAPSSSTDDHLHYSSPYAAPNTSRESTDYFCYKCGRGIAPDLVQCPYCRAPQVPLSSKSKVTAGFLAFFVGGLGVHRFYLGQWWGIFYLIFWVTSIPSIISFIEAFVFWFSSQERWQRKYGQVPASNTGLMVGVIAAGAFVMIMITGILAAVALPAYQDYTHRAKVQASLPLINETRQKVTDVIKQKDFLPSENVLAGLPENISNQFISSITLSEGAKMVVTFNIPGLSDGRNTIIWTPARRGSELSWTCTTGSMPDKYRMPECRGGDISAATPVQESRVDSTQASVRIYSDDKKISLSVPGTWKGNRKLNPSAILGVANTLDEVYAMVLREPKVNFDSNLGLKDYTGFVYAGLESSIPMLKVLEPVQNLKINGMPAQQQSLVAELNGTDIVYVVTTIESDSQFYSIYASTTQSRFERNKALLRQVTGSFTEH